LSLDTWKALLEDTPELQRKSLFVIFNKIDLLDIKLYDFSTFKTQFPEYKGPKTREGAIEYIQQMFMDVVPDGFDANYIAYFPCCALDRGLMGKIFDEAKTQLFSRRLGAAGLAL